VSNEDNMKNKCGLRGSTTSQVRESALVYAPESPKETPSDHGRIITVVTTVISGKRGSSMYGRVGGAQPVPRAFYSERPLPGDDAPSLVEEFDDSMRRQRDLTALRDAREKRDRKNKKRQGEERS